MGCGSAEQDPFFKVPSPLGPSCLVSAGWRHQGDAIRAGELLPILPAVRPAAGLRNGFPVPGVCQ